MTYLKSVNAQLAILLAIYYICRRFVIQERKIGFKYRKSIFISIVSIIIMVIIFFRTVKNSIIFYDYSNRGLIQYSANNFQNAIESYKEALNYKKDDFKTLYNIGIAYLELNDYKNADMYFKQSIEINPFFYEGLIASAKANTGLGKYDESIKILEKLLTLNSNNPEAKYLLENAMKQKLTINN